MNENERRDLIEGYLERLSEELDDIPASARRELIEDVRSHIEEAWAASEDHSRAALLNILERLGEPETLAREERDRSGLPSALPEQKQVPLIAQSGTLSNRAVEWVLGIVGVALSIAGALFVWVSGPFASVWPFPALALVMWVILGFAGLAGVALDGEGGSRRWGLLTWGATGALLGSAIVGLLEFGLFVLPSAVVLALAGVLGDRRRGRNTLRQLPVAAAAGAASLVLILATLVVAAAIYQYSRVEASPKYPSYVTAPARPVPTTEATGAPSTRPSSAQQVEIPNVIGLPEAEARRLILAVGLTITQANYQGPGDTPDEALNRVPPGHVLSQTPAPGTLAPRGTAVHLAVREQ